MGDLKTNWLNDDEQVKDYMMDVWDLYENEGIEKAFKKWKALPKEQRTESELDRICRFTGQIIINQNDPSDWMPVV